MGRWQPFCYEKIINLGDIWKRWIIKHQTLYQIRLKIFRIVILGCIFSIGYPFQLSVFTDYVCGSCWSEVPGHENLPVCRLYIQFTVCTTTFETAKLCKFYEIKFWLLTDYFRSWEYLQIDNWWSLWTQSGHGRSEWGALLRKIFVSKNWSIPVYGIAFAYSLQKLELMKSTKDDSVNILRLNPNLFKNLAMNTIVNRNIYKCITSHGSQF